MEQGNAVEVKAIVVAKPRLGPHPHTGLAIATLVIKQFRTVAAAAQVWSFSVAHELVSVGIRHELDALVSFFGVSF